MCINKFKIKKTKCKMKKKDVNANEYRVNAF